AAPRLGAAPAGGVVGSLRELGDDRLRLEVVVERVVAHLAAPARLLVAAERHCGVEHAVAVDPHGPGAQTVRGPVRLVDVARPDPGGETEAGLVAGVDDVLLGAER